jgi:hypothetical protein
MTNQPAHSAPEPAASTRPTPVAPRQSGLTHSVNAAIDEIRACIDERRQSPVSLARQRLAAHHAAARLRRRIGGPPGDGVQP